MRAFGARGWDRASYRLPLDRPATINGRPARTIDASPSGLALSGVPETLGPGDPVRLAIAFDDGSEVQLHGRITDRRSSGIHTSVGVALELSDEEWARWIRRLFSAAGITGRVPALSGAPIARRPLAFERERAPLRRTISTMVPAVLVTAVSAIVASALLVAFLGYRPMVERSGSMVPRLRIGDVVLAEWVHADRIRPGQIVTFPRDIGRTELVTHRVQRVRVVGQEVRVVTKGDANLDPEQWSVSRNTLVGRVVWTVPRVGALMTALGAALVRRLLLAVSSLIILACGVVAFARRRQEAASG
jgi:signal peptidase I